MNTITARHLVKTAKQQKKKSIFFAMSLEKSPMDWTEADFARECVQYCERRDQIESLKADQDAHGSELLSYFRENEIKDFTVVNKTITATARSKKKYSRKCEREEERLKQQIKNMKELEEKSGDCSVVKNEYNHITVSSAGEVHE
jgi:hypothetical protein